MAQTAEARAKALETRCPTCGAEPRFGCAVATGAPLFPLVHMERLPGCENIVHPTNEARARACGKPAGEFVGKWRCPFHAIAAKKRRALTAT